jgi:biopolymer transport protein TolQ
MTSILQLSAEALTQVVQGLALRPLTLFHFLQATNPVESIGQLAGPTDGLSPIKLFLNASLTVQIVMIGLLFASIWSWAIIIEKLITFGSARRENNRFEQSFWSGQSLEDLYGVLSRQRTHSMSALFVAAMREWKRTVDSNPKALRGILLRVEKVMDVTISRELERLENRLLFLATVGSTAPFVGLFGTVWGIMTSFQAIAASKNTNLAVVAPGIAEALFATALGLLAAIPSVIFYNKFSSEASRIEQRLGGFADEFAAIVSRQVDTKM